MEFDKANKKDVLLGRGKSSNDWEGNVFFRETVGKRAEEYFRAHGNTAKRHAIANEVIGEIEANGGRFIQLQKLRSASDAPNRWLVLSKAAVLTKVKQALRDANRPSMLRRAPSSARTSLTRSSPNPSQKLKPLTRRDSGSLLPGYMAGHAENILSQMPDSKSIGAMGLVNFTSNTFPAISTQEPSGRALCGLNGPIQQWPLMYQSQPERIFPPTINHDDFLSKVPQASNISSYFQPIDPKFQSSCSGTNFGSLLDPGQRSLSNVGNAYFIDDPYARNVQRNTSALSHFDNCRLLPNELPGQETLSRSNLSSFCTLATADTVQTADNFNFGRNVDHLLFQRPNGEISVGSNDEKDTGHVLAQSISGNEYYLKPRGVHCEKDTDTLRPMDADDHSTSKSMNVGPHMANMNAGCDPMTSDEDDASTSSSILTTALWLASKTIEENDR